jgi:hypothetical protein
MTLQTAFAEATGWKTNKQQSDPIHSAVSLDRPLGDEPDGDTLGTITPDPVDPIQAVENRMFCEELHQLLDCALSDLPSEAEGILRARYYGGVPWDRIADRLGKPQSTVTSTAVRAYRKLRRSKYLQGVREFVEDRTNYYQRVPARSQRAPVEELVIRREWLEENFSPYRIAGL